MTPELTYFLDSTSEKTNRFAIRLSTVWRDTDGRFLGEQTYRTISVYGATQAQRTFDELVPKLVAPFEWHDKSAAKVAPKPQIVFEELELLSVDEDGTPLKLLAQATFNPFPWKGKPSCIGEVTEKRIAARFTSKLQSYLGEKWAEVQSGACGANDLCDANQLLIDAFFDVCGREPFFPFDVEEGLATEADLNSDFDTLERIWNLAKQQWANV